MRIAALLGLLLIATPAAAQGPTGEYRIVAVRAASDTPGGPLAPELREQTVGRAMMFTPKLWWYDDRTCVSGRLRPAVEPWSGRDDPMLSDLQATAGGKDHRRNATLVIDCGGRAFTEITPFLVVDSRVLVARTKNGAAYLIFERAPTKAEALAVEEGLARRGLETGPIDGVLDPASRRALGLFAQRQGAAYAFDQGVLTQNLLEGLRKLD